MKSLVFLENHVIIHVFNHTSLKSEVFGNLDLDQEIPLLKSKGTMFPQLVIREEINANML